MEDVRAECPYSTVHTGLRHIPLWTDGRRDAPFDVYLFTLGHTVILTGRIYIPGNSHVAISEIPCRMVPSETLLSHLCQPCPRQLLFAICLGLSYDTDRLYLAAFAGAPTLSQGIQEIQISGVVMILNIAF